MDEVNILIQIFGLGQREVCQFHNQILSTHNYPREEDPEMILRVIQDFD